jgi:hypothetical protein
MESTIDIVRAHAAIVKNCNADRRSTREKRRADMRLRGAAGGMRPLQGAGHPEA